MVYLEEDVSIQRNFTEWANPNQDFMVQLVQHLEGLGERINSIDLDDLRDTFLVKQRHDGRVETCLRLLRSAGCSEGDLGRDLSWLRTPSSAEIAEWLPEDKHKRDLMSLLHMVQYAKGVECRKKHIHGYFGFDDGPENCGSCDVCLERAAWLASALPESQRTAIGSSPAPSHQDVEGNSPVRRGDWIKVRGLGLCAVKRVHVNGKRVTVDVELARDLSTRSLDLWRARWDRVSQ